MFSLVCASHVCSPTYYDCEYYISYRATKAGEPTVGVVTMTNAAYKQVRYRSTISIITNQ
jgi:hypothetical protein